MSRRAARLFLCALFAAQLLRPVSGHAAPSTAGLSEATAAFAELRYDDALRLLDALWRQGGSDPRQLRQIFELAGRAAAVIGEAQAARLWFARWLSLEPGAALPEGTSPKLTQLLDEARARLGGVPLEVRASRRARSDETTVELRADPAALIATVRAGATRAPIQAGHLTTSAPELELLDRHGNVVAIIAVVTIGEAGAPAAEAAPARPPWAARWTTWAVAAGVTATGGGLALVFAARADARLDELAQHSADHDFAEVAAEERSLARAQWIARIGLGAAVASAALAAVFYFREDEPRPTVTASPHGVALSWEMSF